jgi:iron(III) transport system ATP-binding protein
LSRNTLRVVRNNRPDRAELRRRVDEALDMVGLAGLAARSATQLSGGQQQRVALARAMIDRPHLLLLDEPLSNLDASLRDEMRVALKTLQRRVGVTTIYVTHDQAEALEMSDHIAVMYRGHIIQLGTPRDIYDRPVDAFVADFVGGTNLLTGTLEGVTETRGRIRLADGSAVTCGLVAGLRAGTQMAASVRPEAVTVLSLGAPPCNDRNRLLGRVVSTGFAGAAMRCVITAAGVLLRASLPPDSGVAPNDEVLLDFPIEATLGLPLSTTASR